MFTMVTNAGWRLYFLINRPETHTYIDQHKN